MKKFIKNLFRFLILIILLACFVAIGIVAYSEIQGTDAKEHLIKTYDFGDWNIFAIYSKEYVYEKEVDCSTLWFKKCTDDKNLYKEFIFITTKGEKIKVTEYKNGDIVDDYKKKDSE